MRWIRQEDTRPEIGDRRPDRISGLVGCEVWFVFVVLSVLMGFDLLWAGAEEQPHQVFPIPSSRLEGTVWDQTISLDLRGVALEQVLRIFADKTGMNFLYSGILSAEPVNVYLRDVSMRDALIGVLKANGLWYRREGPNVLVIELAPEGPPPEVVTQVVPLKYAAAAELEALVRGRLTSSGDLSIDTRTNSLVITDRSENVEMLVRLLKPLDRPTGQVFIEAEIVEVNLTASKELGISWDWLGHESSTRTAMEGSFDRPGDPIEGMLELWFGKFASYSELGDFQGTIRALIKEGVANMLAHPRILSIDQKPATIRITEHTALAKKVTVQGGVTGGGVAVTEPIYGDVGVTLTVTPRIMGDGFVQLDLSPSVSSAQRSVFFPGDAVDTKERTAQTTVMVQNGQTVVIGGLMRDDVTKSANKIPLLGDLPLIGRLFGKTVTDVVKTEIIVSLTPRVVLPEDLAQMAQEARQKLNTTLHKKD